MPSRRQKGLTRSDLANWPDAEPDVVTDPDAVSLFDRRKIAIEEYASGTRLAEIERTTRVPPKELYRLIDRCQAKYEDGNIAGYRALIPYQHIPTIRVECSEKNRSTVPMPGSMSALLAAHPRVTKELHSLAITGKRSGLATGEARIPIGVIHTEFVKLCDEEKITAPYYPFNSESRGKPAIARWVARERKNHALQRLASLDPAMASKARPRNSADSIACAVSRCFERVECDGHRIDVEIELEVPSPKGVGTVHIRVHRIWIIVLLEIKSSAVLGYALAIGKNYSGSDLVRAVECALRPWQRRKLVVKGVDYRDGEGLPSGVVEGLSYVCFDELWLDNFIAHRSHYVLSHLERTVNAVPVFGPVGEPDSRPYVEGFFGLLEEAGFHRLHETTGSNPTDNRRKRRSHNSHTMTYDELADFIDLLIARINSTRSPGTDMSRLEILRDVSLHGSSLIRRIPAGMREGILRFDLFEEGVIGHDHGRPVVRFKGGRYRNDRLSAAFGLIGRPILIQASSKALRRIQVILDDGSDLGELLVERRWRSTEHSLWTRLEIKKLENLGVLADCDDLVFGFRRYLEQKASSDKSAATFLTRLRLEQDGTTAMDGDYGGKGEEVELGSDSEEGNDDTGAPDLSISDLLANVRAVYR